MAQWFRVLIAVQRTWVPLRTHMVLIHKLTTICTPGLGGSMPSLGVCQLQAHTWCADSMRAEVLLSDRIFICLACTSVWHSTVLSAFPLWEASQLSCLLPRRTLSFLVYSGREGPGESGQFQGLQEASLSCLPSCWRNFLKDGMFQSLKKVLHNNQALDSIPGTLNSFPSQAERKSCYFLNKHLRNYACMYVVLFCIRSYKFASQGIIHMKEKSCCAFCLILFILLRQGLTM